MSTDRDWQRLCELYADKSDAELLSLHEDRLDLTQIAQEALAQVMRERKLDGSVAEFGHSEPESNAPEEFADEESEALHADEVCLWVFREGISASQASSSLVNAGIEHRFVPASQIYGAENVSAASMEMALIIHKADKAEAVGVLRKSVGLFPLPEDGTSGAVDLDPLGDLVLLLSFDQESQMAEALEVVKLLAEAGISFQWRDRRDSPESLPEEENLVIEVRAPSLARAQKILEEHFASQA